MVSTFTDQQLLQTALGELNFLVWTKNVRTGELVFLNDNFEKLYHRSRIEFETNPELLTEIVHPDDKLDFLLFSKPMQHKGDIEVRYRIQLPEGKWKWLGERRKIIKDKSGRIVMVHAIVSDVSQRVKAESEMVEMEKAYRQFFHHNSYALWIYDVETLEFLEVNEAAVKQYGYSRSEFLKMTVKQIRPQEDVPFLIQMLSVELDDRDIPKYWRHRRKDGSLFYVKVLSNRVVFKGRVCNMILAVDITVERMGNPFEAIPENQPSHVYLVLDKFGKVHFADHGICSVLETEAEALLGCSISTLATDLNLNNDFSKALKRNNANWHGLLQLEFGQVKKVFSGRLINPQDGSQMLLLLQSSTRHQELTDKILNFENNLHHLLNTVTDGLVLLDNRLKIILANPQFALLVNTPLGKLSGQKLWDLLNPEDAIKLNQFIKKAIRKQETIRFEEFFPAFNSWIDISVYPSQEGLTVYFRDITHRKKEEVEKQDLLHHLISQNKAMEEFAYLTSHNVRSHVANIQMLSSLLSGNYEDEQEIVKKLITSSVKLDQITRDLSQMLSIHSRDGFKLESIAVEPIISQVLSRFVIGTTELYDIVELNLESGLLAKAYDKYLESILQHVVQNAIRFRQENIDFGLRISTFGKAENMFLVIEDNGQGFDLEQNRQQLFGLFRTFHPTIMGRGLGLYMVKMMIDSMGGCIDFQSEMGKGTKITIQLSAA